MDHNLGKYEHTTVISNTATTVGIQDPESLVENTRVEATVQPPTRPRIQQSHSKSQQSCPTSLIRAITLQGNMLVEID